MTSHCKRQGYTETFAMSPSFDPTPDPPRSLDHYVRDWDAMEIAKMTLKLDNAEDWKHFAPNNPVEAAQFFSPPYSQQVYEQLGYGKRLQARPGSS